jgi:phytoene/squalene synthetase
MAWSGERLGSSVKQLTGHNALLRGLGVSKKHKPVFEAYDRAIRALALLANNPLATDEAKRRQLDDIRQLFFGSEDKRKKNEWEKLGQLFALENLDSSLFCDVLQAVEDDVMHKPVRIWEELLQYCRLYAATQGRFLMTVCGENPSTYLPIENWCVVVMLLDIIGHIQETIGRNHRCLIPEEMLQNYGVQPTDLGVVPRLAAVNEMYVEILRRAEGILADAFVLPTLLHSYRKRFRCAVMLSLTNSLLQSYKKSFLTRGTCRLSIGAKITAIGAGIKRLFVR